MQRLERLEQRQIERENQAKQLSAPSGVERERGGGVGAGRQERREGESDGCASVVSAELGSQGADSFFVNLRLQPAKSTWATALQRRSELREHMPEKTQGFYGGDMM